MELHFVRGEEVARAYVLDGPQQTRWLNGASAPIYDVNELESITLTDATVGDYLRFFLYFLRGDAGPFVLVESADDLEVQAGDGCESGTDAPGPLRSLVRPLVKQGVEDGRWLFNATVAYDGALFGSSFAVGPGGDVEMIDDTPLGPLGPVSAPPVPELELSERLPHDREVTEAIVGVLLEDGLQDLAGGSMDDNLLLRRFNLETQAGKPVEQLKRLVKESNPVIIVESDVPFVEDFVAGVVAPERLQSDQVERAHAMSEFGDDLRCQITLRESGRLYLLSFHTYRGLFDADRMAHELSLTDATVLIGCDRVTQVPEPLRTVTDLVIRFPRLDHRRFGRAFQRVFHAEPRDGWQSSGADWTRYLVPADFHIPRRLNLDPDEALALLQERVQNRLQQVTPDAGPRLAELHGLGEARQIAADLVADIQAAQAGRIPWSAVDRGLLLVGAPGTGKTTLARAIARECGIKIVIASAASWQAAGYLHEHLRAMRADFAEARRCAPAILFLDEIDSIGSRERFEGGNAQYQTEVVNAMLEEIQSITSTDSVIVVAATNYPDRVDPALRRAGRLDQVVPIQLPNIDGLEQILVYHLARFKADGGNVHADIDERVVAELAFGLTGADIEFFVRGAARRARRGNRPISQEDLVAEVTGRPRRPDSVAPLGPAELHRIAVHEAGHTAARLISSTQGEDLTYASIIPRADGTLGFVASVPTNTRVMTGRIMMEQLETALAGRAAEEVVFGADRISAGAGGPGPHSDLAVATHLATLFVCQSGLAGEDSLRWTTVPTAGQELQVDDLLRKSYASIVARLELQRGLLDRIAQALEQKQELSGRELRQLAFP